MKNVNRVGRAIAATAMLQATVLCADVINVPGDYSTVASAIANAQSGDEILVSAGTWTAAVGYSFGGKQLHLRSVDGPGSTVLAVSLSSRVLTMLDPGSSGSSIDGFTLRGGVAVSGGGLLVGNGVSVTVSDCIFENNEATSGNGGGARVTSSANADFSDCVFRSNIASGEGGGLSLEANGGFVVQRCRFEGNLAGENGGGASVGAEAALDKGESFPRILNSVFSGNESGAAGGGAYVYAAAASSPFEGPGTIRQGGVYGCTFSANEAVSGGGVTGGRPFEQGNALAVVNCILSNNVGGYGTVDLGGFEVPLSPNFFHCCVDFLSAEVAAGSGSIVTSPRFVSEYGSDGVAGTGDEILSLLPGSPAVDAGYVYFGAPSPLIGSFDVSGQARVVDSTFVVDTGERDGPFPGPIVDMGAHEFADASVLGNVAVWIGDGGAFDGSINWYGGVTPGVGAATWLDGPDSPVVGTTLGSSAVIGELYVNSGSWMVEGTNAGSPELLSVGREGSVGTEPGDIFIGPFRDQRGSFGVVNLDVSCNQLFVARGEYSMEPDLAGSEVELTADSVFVATDSDSGLASTFRGRGLVSTSPVGILPSFWNLGITQPSGPLVVDGNFYQSGGITFPGIIGRLRFDLASPTQSVSVTGRAVLGGPVEFIIDADDPPALSPGDVFPILAAVDGFDGTEFSFAVTSGLGEGLFMTLSTEEAFGGTGSSVVATVNSVEELLFGEATSGSTDPVADFVLEDVNGDDAVDLVLSVPDPISPGGADGDVVILLNQGTSGAGWGGFGSAIAVEVGTQPAGLDAGDLDGDGDIDVAVANRVTGTITILLNDGNDPPSFATQDVDSSPTLTGSADPLDVYIGNLDGEGFADLVVTNGADGLVVAFKNETAFVGGGFSNDDGTESDPGASITKFDPGDADGKDKEDRVVGITVAGNAVVFTRLSSGLGAGIVLSWDTAPVGSDPVDLARGDFNQDGVEDVVTANQSGGTISILLGDGSGAGFDYGAASTIAVGSDIVAIDVGDLDGDEDDDLAVVCRDSGGDRVVRTIQNMFIPSGQLNFLVLPNDELAGQAPSLLRVGDVDADGEIADVVAITSASALAGSGVDGFSAFLGLGEELGCDGDLNSDGIVDAADLGLLISGWGAIGDDSRDLTGDSVVDAADLGLLIAFWGPCPDGS